MCVLSKIRWISLYPKCICMNGALNSPSKKASVGKCSVVPFTPPPFCRGPRHLFWRRPFTPCSIPCSLHRLGDSPGPHRPCGLQELPTQSARERPELSCRGRGWCRGAHNHPGCGGYHCQPDPAQHPTAPGGETHRRGAGLCGKAVR